MTNKTQEVIDRAISEIGEAKNIQQGAIAAMDALSQAVRDNMEDPAALEAVLDDFDASKAELAAAIVRNTPASEEPPPPPPAEEQPVG